MCKIISIEFINHPIFKTTVFDFTNGKGVADTIVFAGENGAGKTRLVEELYYGTKAKYTVDAPVRTECQTIIELDLADEDFYNLENPRERVLTARLITSSDSDSTEINYIAKRPVTGVTDEVLDSGVLKESDDVARDITQLLVDISSQNNDDIALAVRRNIVPIFEKTVKKSSYTHFLRAKSRLSFVALISCEISRI
ncbi:hypothetical protein IJ765_00365 [Candidatus Saccharibacteria bacterium]|nr:hypothetical protein [Candidatus Saccharibacteria bacterium]